MTIDVYVRETDEDFFEELEDIMEDTMVQMFILHPKDARTLEAVQEAAAEHGCLFYAAPLSLAEEIDENCVAFSLLGDEDMQHITGIGKPLFIDEALLDATRTGVLSRSGAKGIICNATQEHPELAGFKLGIGPGSMEAFDSDTLNGLDMDRIVLHSGYPAYGFDDIHATAKKISDVMFRPEQSIIARATKSSLELFGFRK